MVKMLYIYSVSYEFECKTFTHAASVQNVENQCITLQAMHVEQFRDGMYNGVLRTVTSHSVLTLKQT